MDVLLLDFDNMADAGQVVERLPFTMRKLGIRVRAISCEFSSSKRGIHTVVYIGELLPPFMIVALQILCGSDWRRETFNLVRARSLRHAPAFWIPFWNVLYSEKWRGERPDDKR